MYIKKIRHGAAGWAGRLDHVCRTRDYDLQYPMVNTIVVLVALCGKCWYIG